VRAPSAEGNGTEEEALAPRLDRAALSQRGQQRTRSGGFSKRRVVAGRSSHQLSRGGTSAGGSAMTLLALLLALAQQGAQPTTPDQTGVAQPRPTANRRETTTPDNPTEKPQ